MTPGRFSRAVAGAAGILTIVVSGMQLVAPIFTVPGIATLILGSRNDSRTVCRFGAGIAVPGVLLSGFGTISPGFALVGAALLALAWDSGEYAITIATVPQDTETSRVEFVHTGVTALVLTATGCIGYVIYRFAPEGLAAGTVVILLLGGAVLTALRE